MDKSILKKLHNTEVEILDEIVRICEKHSIDYFLIGGTLLGAVRHKGFIPWDDDLDIAMPRDSYERFQEICKHELSEDYFLDSHKTNPGYWLPFIKIRKNNTIYLEKINSYNQQNHKGVWVDIFPLDEARKISSKIQSIQGKAVKSLQSVGIYKLGYDKPKKLKAKFLFFLTIPFSIEFVFSIQEKVMKFWNNNNREFFINFGSQYGVKKQTMPKDKYYPPIKIEFSGKLYNAPNDFDYVLKRIYGEYMELPPVEKRTTHNPIKIEL